jgi:ArsR family transcriptional regulator
MSRASPPFDIDAMRRAAGEASAMLKALANPERLLLLCQLTEGELSVGQLEERLGIRQPTLSQQLAVLRREQLVQTRREGKNIFYRVADPAALTLLQTLYDIYCSDQRGKSR